MSAGFQMTELSFTVPAPYPMPAGYFRSKLFSSNAASNPLVAAASPLLSLIERLGVTQTLPLIESLRDNFEHELLAFHSRINGQHFAEEVITLSHYLLSATIDELLGKNYIRLYEQPTQFKAFTPPSSNGFGPETQFFVVLEHLKERANQYLDVLELAYYCLIAGFEGQYHVKTDGRQILDNWIEDIHKIIQQHRVHKPILLFQENSRVSVEAPANHKSLFIMMAISVSVLLASYIGAHQLINHQAKQLLTHYSMPIHMDV